MRSRVLSEFFLYAYVFYNFYMFENSVFLCLIVVSVFFFFFGFLPGPAPSRPLLASPFFRSPAPPSLPSCPPRFSHPCPPLPSRPPFGPPLSMGAISYQLAFIRVFYYIFHRVHLCYIFLIFHFIVSFVITIQHYHQHHHHHPLEDARAMQLCFFCIHRPKADGGRVLLHFPSPTTPAEWWLLEGLCGKYGYNILSATDAHALGHLSDL
jgi:hypothetical protein